MEFIKDDFLLNNNLAKELYKKAQNIPIYDYHCHLSAEEIYEDKPFSDLYEIWLKGDHYKYV
jgi:glucuronate isomerase